MAGPVAGPPGGAPADRLTRLRLAALMIAQAVAATSASWALARSLKLGGVAVFAPIAALITLTISLTQRLRRVIERSASSWATYSWS